MGREKSRKVEKQRQRKCLTITGVNLKLLEVKNTKVFFYIQSFLGIQHLKASYGF